MYKSLLEIYDTQAAINLVKDTFESSLAINLNLHRVTAPLFVNSNSGLNDNLNGVERPVLFDAKNLNESYEIVHSLAKWKRLALKQYCFRVGKGLYTDMNAIRRDEDLDALHSLYVDQWDWEKIITKEQRNVEYLKDTVNAIVKSIKQTEYAVCGKYPVFKPYICDECYFITSQELLDRYPNLSAKEREHAICREYKTVFIMQIGDVLSNGTKHDGRAPDYDDWELNGDLLVYYPLMDRSIELSSMGIRVDEESMMRQLEKANCLERKGLPYHKMLLNHELPLTIGGGIGQSRLCMVLLQKAHIGEVQVGCWSQSIIDECKKKGIELL